jgi:hypothetical protein
MCLQVRLCMHTSNFSLRSHCIPHAKPIAYKYAQITMYVYTHTHTHICIHVSAKHAYVCIYTHICIHDICMHAYLPAECVCIATNKVNNAFSIQRNNFYRQCMIFRVACNVCLYMYVFVYVCMYVRSELPAMCAYTCMYVCMYVQLPQAMHDLQSCLQCVCVCVCICASMHTKITHMHTCIHRPPLECSDMCMYMFHHVIRT